MAKISVESSEIMAAVAMLMTPATLNGYLKKGFVGLVSFLKDGRELATSGKVVYPPGNVYQEFLKAFVVFGEKDNPYFIDKDFLTAAAQGISAAKSIRDWVPARSKESGVPITNMVCDKVYLTGDEWPKEVQQYQVKAYGFNAYNSSDIIFQWNNPKGLSFFGVSLKKKPTESSPDPTIINKAFDSALQGAEFDAIKEEVVIARRAYFAKVVREGTRVKPPGDKNPYLTIIGGSLPVKGEAGDKQLMGLTIRAGDEKRNLINLKGKGTIDLTNTDKDQRDKGLFFLPNGNKFQKADMRKESISFRAYVNKRVASSDSVYTAMVKVLNKHSELFAESLLNLVLKTRLFDELDKNAFAFALVTGIGKLDSNLSPTIAVEKAKGLKTVLCGISALNKGDKKYEMVLDDEKNRTSTGAKVYLKLIKGKVTVLDMELRYKGSFTSQPQFFATISNDFKGILSEQYGKKCIVP
jgi:hypothetical protein